MVVVLMHHPICGWAQEKDDQHGTIWRANLSRWALLAHETRECDEIIKLLREQASVTPKQIFLCGGHRHGQARVGHPAAVTGDTTVADRGQLWIMESAAVLALRLDGPEENRSLLGLEFDPDNGLVPCRIDHASSFAKPQVNYPS